MTTLPSYLTASGNWHVARYCTEWTTTVKRNQQAKQHATTTCARRTLTPASTPHCPPSFPLLSLSSAEKPESHRQLPDPDSQDKLTHSIFPQQTASGPPSDHACTRRAHAASPTSPRTSSLAPRSAPPSAVDLPRPVRPARPASGRQRALCEALRQPVRSKFAWRSWY